MRKQFAATSFKAAHKLQSMECVGSFPADGVVRLWLNRGEKNFNNYIIFHRKAPQGWQEADGGTMVCFSAAHKIRNQIENVPSFLCCVFLPTLCVFSSKCIVQFQSRHIALFTLSSQFWVFRHIFAKYERDAV